MALKSRVHHLVWRIMLEYKTVDNLLDVYMMLGNEIEMIFSIFTYECNL